MVENEENNKITTKMILKQVISCLPQQSLYSCRKARDNYSFFSGVD